LLDSREVVLFHGSPAWIVEPESLNCRKSECQARVDDSCSDYLVSLACRLLKTARSPHQVSVCIYRMNRRVWVGDNADFALSQMCICQSNSSECSGSRQRCSRFKCRASTNRARPRGDRLIGNDSGCVLNPSPELRNMRPVWNSGIGPFSSQKEQELPYRHSRGTGWSVLFQ
jgi:hypothetical protein